MTKPLKKNATYADLCAVLLQLDGKRWSLTATHEGGTRVRAEPFAAIELDLRALWA